MADVRNVVFLMYHELEVPGRPLCQSEAGYVRYVLPVQDFQAQLQWLKRAGWSGLSVSEALTFGTEPGLAITFDDGCETDLLAAAPLLQEMGFGATFYITCGFLGKPGYLSATQLRELSRLGFEIGCHSMTHPYLTDLDHEGLQREIVGAKLRLEHILGKTVDHFSCPGGRCDSRVAETASRAGYRTVSTSRARANSRSTDPFALGRVPVMRGTGLPKFEALCQGRGLWHMSASHTVRSTARRLLGNSVYDRVRTAMLRQRT